MEFIAHTLFHALFDSLFGYYLDRHPQAQIGLGIVLSLTILGWGISDWWDERKARLRVRRAIGPDMSGAAEFSSIYMWMKVVEEEGRKQHHS